MIVTDNDYICSITNNKMAKVHTITMTMVIINDDNNNYDYHAIVDHPIL